MVALPNKLAAAKYDRRHPEESLLFRTVQCYWPLFLNEQKRVGKILPHFIKDEFQDFLKCGIAEHGFVRTYCHECRYPGIVAFSCKRRGFCPSCCARRMNIEAAHLVDTVLPEVSYRQWVLSFPFKLRFLMARSQELTNKALKIYTQSIQLFQSRRAKRGGLGHCETGVITFIQRFGSALNLNIHFHSLIPDGVFLESEDGYLFYKQGQPTREDLLAIVNKINKKVLKCAEKMGLLGDDCQQSFNEESLMDYADLSIANKSGFGERAGKNIRRYGVKRIEVEYDDAYSVNVDGFSLNARVCVSGGDREKLEKLIRYMARGPVASERLTESFPNQLLYKMKSVWKDGTTHVSFSPLDFIARLVALIPPPRMNMIRYHGCFAPNFKNRKFLVKKRVVKVAPPSVEAQISRDLKERLKWASMLKRVFKVDVTVCPRCSGRLEQIAVIKDKATARKIIESLGELTTYKGLETTEDRGPPSEPEVEDNFDQRDPTW